MLCRMSRRMDVNEQPVASWSRDGARRCFTSVTAKVTCPTNARIFRDQSQWRSWFRRSSHQPCTMEFTTDIAFVTKPNPWAVRFKIKPFSSVFRAPHTALTAVAGGIYYFLNQVAFIGG